MAAPSSGKRLSCKKCGPSLLDLLIFPEKPEHIHVKYLNFLIHCRMSTKFGQPTTGLLLVSIYFTPLEDLGFWSQFEPWWGIWYWRTTSLLSPNPFISKTMVESKTHCLSHVNAAGNSCKAFFLDPSPAVHSHDRAHEINHIIKHLFLRVLWSSKNTVCNGIQIKP